LVFSVSRKQNLGMKEFHSDVLDSLFSSDSLNIRGARGKMSGFFVKVADFSFGHVFDLSQG
jgi:hypothetical protein